MDEVYNMHKQGQKTELQRLREVPYFLLMV